MGSFFRVKNLNSGITRSIAQGAIIGAILGAAFAGGYFFRDFANQLQYKTTSFDLLHEADSKLQQNYVHDLPDDKARIHGAVQGLVASLGDPYTYFVEPATAEVDSTSLAGSFGGIGVEIVRDGAGNYVVSKVYRDNPAFDAGILEGDQIVAVDGNSMDTREPDMNALLALVRGKVGSSVKITVLRNEEELDFNLVRKEILIPSTYWKLVSPESKVGYIQITRFTERSPEEVRQAITELEEQGAEALVLDLRNNGGGLVDSAVGVAGQFLDGGVILYENTRSGSERIFNAPRGGLALDVPLIVLVNNGTASASEIVAGALQSRGRAELLGQQTYGKGSVQVILPLSDGSSLHVTTAEWFTPDHQPLQGKGLSPDHPVESVAEQDIELANAVKLLEIQIADK